MAEQEFNDFNVELDLSGDDVQAWGGERRPLVPPGDYKFTIVNVENKNSNNGNPMISVAFEVAEGECQGQRAYNNYNYTTKPGAGRLKQLMVACGASLASFQASQIMGQQITGTVVHEEGKPGVDQNGNPREAGVFANVINEQPLEDAPPPKAEVKAPPVTNKAPANGAAKAQGSARRA